jgi:hypothetical protein
MSSPASPASPALIAAGDRGIVLSLMILSLIDLSGFWLSGLLRYLFCADFLMF